MFTDFQGRCSRLRWIKNAVSIAQISARENFHQKNLASKPSPRGRDGQVFATSRGSTGCGGAQTDSVRHTEAMSIRVFILIHSKRLERFFEVGED